MDLKELPKKPVDFKTVRKKLYLTLRDVEFDTGISNGYLSQLECGKIESPSYNTVVTLNNYYYSKFIEAKG
jgi:transcriptional regulator with XRE-family HTH domain